MTLGLDLVGLGVPSNQAEYLERQFNYVLTPQRFDQRAGRSSVDSQNSVQNMIDATITENSLRRRAIGIIPPGDYMVTNLTVSDVQGGSIFTRGNAVIRGAGKQSTRLISQASTGDVLKIKAGRVSISDMTITSDGINRGVTLGNGSTSAPTAAIGSGNGLVFDDGVVPRAATIANLLVDNVEIFSQPGHGFFTAGGEMVDMRNVVVIQCGEDGYRFDGTNTGGATLGIANILNSCRALWCRGRALTELAGVGGIYNNFEALLCDGNSVADANDGYHIWSTAAGTIMIALDMEGDGNAADKTLNLIGAIFAGSGVQIIGGLLHGFHTAGLKFVGAGTGQRVTGIRIANTAESGTYSMTYGIDASGATDFYADIPAVGTGVTNAFNGAAVLGNFQKAGSVIDDARITPLRTALKASLPSAATYVRGLIYVSDETGGATPAFSDGTNWRRVADRAIVS